MYTKFKRNTNSRSGNRGAAPFSRFKKGPFNKPKNRFSGKNIDVNKFVSKAVEAKNEEVYVTTNKFVDFKIDNRIKGNILSKGYNEPTPIQDQTIPVILEGKDVVGIANTGTGKTAAFLIPAINKTILNRESKTIIIVPTRELATQIEKEFKDFTIGLKMYSVACIGGTSIGKQIFDLKRSYNFIIGTPGRIKDLVNRRVLNIGRFNTLVLDEADRMLDMGFIDDIKYLIAQMPEQRQSMCFSATFPKEIEDLVQKFLKSPVRVSVKKTESSANVDQDVIKVSDSGKKLEVLCELLEKQNFNKVLIFGKTKYGVEKLSVALSKKGFKAASIHGDKSQSKRERALDSFRADKINILVATDVAARGLDINDISHVINYDVPATYDDYVHRIGRTGRGKKKGSAITFVQ
jgi:superfamily II DNA/RNA helicase